MLAVTPLLTVNTLPTAVELFPEMVTTAVVGPVMEVVPLIAGSGE
jgi:hypothetical protein